jgi:hypothetical protein
MSVKFFDFSEKYLYLPTVFVQFIKLFIGIQVF